MTAEPSTKGIVWHRRLAVRLGVGVLSILALSLPVLLVWQNQEAETRASANQRAHAERISSLISGALSERMLAGGDEQVWREVEALAEQMRETGTALRVQVMSIQGQVKASTDARLHNHRYSLDENGCAHCHTQSGVVNAFPVLVSMPDADGRSISRIFTPIAKQPQCVRCHTAEEAFRGMLAIDFDRSEEEAARQLRIHEALVFAAISALGIFLLIEWLLGRLVNTPLKQLARATRDLASGRLDTRVKQIRDDEIGRVGRGFNDMASRIEQQVGELARNNQELDLLYRLMVDLSGSLSVGDVQATVLRLLWDRLHPDYLVFVVESSDGEWDCAWIDDQGHIGHQRGPGKLEGLAWLHDEGLRLAAPHIGDVATRVALKEHRVIHQLLNEGCDCILPFTHNDQTIGLLYAGRSRDADSMDQEILNNLAVHVGLALSNARNFTHAITDGLTGLYNKRYGAGRLANLVYDANRYGYALGLIMLDIDHFKKVNDTYGHQAGDSVLREVSHRLRVALRQSDLAVRYGGEEFMILLPHADREQTLAVAEKLRRAIADSPAPLDKEGATLEVRISLGTALLVAGESPEQLVERADQALYRAKQGGRNRVEAA